MSRAALLSLALLVALVAPAGATAPALVDRSGPAATDPEAPLNGTPSVLPVPATAEGFATSNADLGTAVSMGTAELRTAFQSRRVDARLAAADRDTERRAILDDALTRVEDRVAALVERQRSAARAYAVGTISERTLLKRLGAVHADAETMGPTLERLSNLAQGLGTDYDRANTVLRRAESLTGPLRESVASALRASGRTQRIHVVAAEEGVVLAAIRDGVGTRRTYVREAVRFDNVDDESGTVFSGAAGLHDFMLERYPWSADHYQASRVVFPGSIHRFRLTHSQGSFVTYVDGSSQRVFREIHELRPEAMPVGTTEAAAGSGLSVVANRTYPGGPLHVAVERTGSATDATVFVGGEEVGRTGVDGELWTVAPRGEANVRASVDGANVTVTL